MLKLRLSLSLLAASSLVVPTANAAPDDVCVRHATGVPGLAVKHPQWWVPGMSPQQRNVRWTGATARYSGDGSTPELVSSRTIWDRPSNTVFFEFNVHADPSIDPLQDIVMFAVGDASGNSPELFVNFQPLNGCATLSNCTGNGSAISTAGIRYAEASTSGTSVTWGALSSTNPSTDFIVEHPWVQVSEVLSGGSTMYDWTLRFSLRVPTVAGNEIRPNLRTYANAVMFMPGPISGTAVEFPVMCNPTSVISNDCLAFSGSSTSTLPDSLPISNMSATWPVTRSTDFNSCEGVEMIRSLVGSDFNTTTSVVPGTNIPYELPGSLIPNTTGARLRAGFLNDSSQGIDAGAVTAEFRVANWGLQYANWDQATWDLVGTAQLSGNVADHGYAGGLGQGHLESDVWVPGTSGLALENTHQCIHVRLRSNDPSVRFKTDSIFRNMDIIEASVARRPADIDLGNRPLPRGHKNHKVYLLVRSEHMPSPGHCRRTKDRAYGCAKGGSLVLGRKAFTKKQKAALSRDVRAGRAKLSQAQLDDLLKQKSRAGKKPAELPYYAVYGMVDTGRRINLPGAPQTPVLKNFSSYGYSVQHDGLPPDGWENFFHGANPVRGTTTLFQVDVKPRTIVTVANTVRVLSRETKACKRRPRANAGVYDLKKTRELERKVKATVGGGSASRISKVRVTDDQFGCEPPPLRLPCKAKDCVEHSPIDYIQGSRYVGDWAAIDRRERKLESIKATPSTPARRPGARTPSPRQPTGARPGARRAPRPATPTRRRGSRRVGRGR